MLRLPYKKDHPINILQKHYSLVNTLRKSFFYINCSLGYIFDWGISDVRLSCAEYLIRSGACKHIKYGGYLYSSCRRGDIAMTYLLLSTLLSNGTSLYFDTLNRSLLAAVRSNIYCLVNVLISVGARDDYKCSCLLASAGAGHANIVQKLVDSLWYSKSNLDDALRLAKRYHRAKTIRILNKAIANHSQ